jgi:hypothetical protein
MLAATIGNVLLVILSVSANEGPYPKAEVTPVGKVVELLDVLKRQVEEDGVADGAMYVEYAAWYRNESASAKRVIKDTSSKISALQADIEEEEAFRTKESARHDKVAGELAKEEKDLTDATDIRNAERKTFGATEETLMNAVDSLERSLQVLGKSAPAAAASAASLLSVAGKLKQVLLQSGDVLLTPTQKDTLNGFLRSVRRGQASGEDGRQQSLAPDFLQLRGNSNAAGDYDKQTGGVTDTLTSVLEKSQEQLQDARTAEAASTKVFVDYSAATQKAIDNKKKTISEIRQQLSQSTQKQSQMESELASAKKTLQVTSENLALIETEFKTKTAGFKERAVGRSDEILAVREASQLLTSEAAQKLLAPPEDAASSASAAMFLQLTKGGRHKSMKALKAMRRKANFVLEHATMPGLALLAIKMHVNAGSHGRRSADPFGKVKAMVRDMLTKLQQQAASEAKHNEFCDSEMSKSTQSKATKEEYLQKLKDRMAAMDAEIEQLGNDIAVTNKDLFEMNSAVTIARQVRGKESTKNVASIAQYKDAQALVGTAVEVLKKFYNKAAETAASADKGHKKKSGLGGGVIGILEIAVQDFADLQAETEEAEATASQQFKELMSDTGVKTAVFTKDLEYNNRDKVKLEADRLRANNDLKNFDKELEAVKAYLASLKSQCIAKAEPYAERKAKREAELASLKEALDFLKGDGMAP